jgi:hypothetical protein
MAETHYFTDDAGASINDGATKYLMKSSADAENDSDTFGGTGHSWNYQRSPATVIVAGTWTVTVYLKRGFGTGTKATVDLRRYNSAGALQETLWSKETPVLTTSILEYNLQDSVGDVVMDDGDYIVAFIYRSAGVAVITIQFNQTAGSYSSRLTHPDEATTWNQQNTLECVGHPLAAIMTPLLPIARWASPPHQRLEEDATYTFGVAAFCAKEGTLGDRIEKVEFRLECEETGGTYDGDDPHNFTAVTSRSANGLYEVTVDESLFNAAAEGKFTMYAKVTSLDGGVRDENCTGPNGEIGLPGLQWVVDTGTLARRWAYVSSVSGDDGTGVTYATAQGSPAAFATLGAAFKQAAIDKGDANGLMICIKPNEDNKFEQADATERVNSQEWATITSWGGDKTNTWINLQATTPMTKAKLIRFYDITIGDTTTPRTACLYSDVLTDNKWLIEDCVHEGYTYPGLVHPIGGAQAVNGIATESFYVNTHSQNVRIAHRGRNHDDGRLMLVRDCTAEDIAEDFCVNGIRCVVNCSCDTINAGAYTYHTDCFQIQGVTPTHAFENAVMMNCAFTNALAHPFLLRRTTHGQGVIANVAMVNVYFQHPDNPVGTSSNCLAQLQGDACHLILWNVTQRWEATGEGLEGKVTTTFGARHQAGEPPYWRDCAWLATTVVGCNFAAVNIASDDYRDAPVGDFAYGGANGLFTDWQHNNYFWPPDGTSFNDTPGSNYTTADPDWSPNGYPGGALGRRISPPLVPRDLDQRVRLDPTAVGAYEQKFAPLRRRMEGY